MHRKENEYGSIDIFNYSFGNFNHSSIERRMNMPRYIDAEALYKETEKKIKEANSYRMAVVDSEFLDLIDDADTADVVPRGEAERYKGVCDDLQDEILELLNDLHNESEYVAKKIFEEIESVLFTIANPSMSADGTIKVKHSEDFHLRREDYYTIKEKYAKGGEGE